MDKNWLEKYVVTGSEKLRNLISLRTAFYFPWALSRKMCKESPIKIFFKKCSNVETRIDEGNTPPEVLNIPWALSNKCARKIQCGNKNVLQCGDKNWLRKCSMEARNSEISSHWELKIPFGSINKNVLRCRDLDALSVGKNWFRKYRWKLETRKSHLTEN